MSLLFFPSLFQKNCVVQETFLHDYSSLVSKTSVSSATFNREAINVDALRAMLEKISVAAVISTNVQLEISNVPLELHALTLW